MVGVGGNGLSEHGMFRILRGESHAGFLQWSLLSRYGWDRVLHNASLRKLYIWL